MAEKTVVIVDEALPRGLASNAAFILGLSLGLTDQHELGPSVRDAEGVLHAGITTVPVPVLAANAATLTSIRRAASAYDSTVLTVVDFSAAAQSSADYGAYADRMSHTATDAVGYRAIVLHGPKKLIQTLTGQLSLLR